jgi:myo-inositol-1(or 4)-monophosphatase
MQPTLNIATRAARAEGRILLRYFERVDQVNIQVKSHNDFVSEVDRAAEEAIIQELRSKYPDHAILAEESGRERGSKHSDYLWIIDPLDGTTNFIHGFPVYAVSIALAFRGKVEQAVVYDPTRNDLFMASRGRGAFLNDRRLRVSKRTRMADALIGTGFPFRKGDNFKRYIRMFEEVMQHCAGVRRPGAAALDLCYVAAGWYDGFFETGLQPWDVAAGSLMITEAGGLVGNFTGEADYLYQRELVAGNPKIYGQLVQTLSPYSRVIVDRDASKPDTDATELGASPPSGTVGCESPDPTGVSPVAPSASGADAVAPVDAAAPGATRKPRRITRAEIVGGSDAPF